MLDYHVHPGYSIDAEPSSIRDYCRRAAAMGLRELCFTPHLEVDPERRHLDWFVRVGAQVCPMEDLTWLDHYFGEIEEARREWKDYGLTVRAGLEAGFDLGLEKSIERVLRDYPFDFVLGSVHCLEHLAISSRGESRLYFPGKKPENVVREYFKVLEEAVATGFFDCLGHVDLYRRYGLFYLGEEVLSAHEAFAAPLFEKIAARGMGLEINTSSLRRGHSDFHPSRVMVNLAHSLGIKIFTVGSDAHRLADLGQGIGAATQLLAELGLQPAAYCRRRLED